ncbi:MAG: class I SAM-dependent methyltransferase [Chlamydiota bacterium]
MHTAYTTSLIDMNLLWLSITTRWKFFTEYLNVLRTDYRNAHYRNADLKLLFKYLFVNPYKISKQYALKHGHEEIYTYGETPIPGLRKIVEECEISPSDHVYELGCGRGRACIWLRHMIGCDVTGIDCIDEYIRRLKDLQDEKLTFIEEDFLDTDLRDATVIYLNGTMLSGLQIETLCKKLATLKSGTKIITVSYPLTDYSPPDIFQVVKEFPIEFHWGTGTVYLQTYTE